MKKDKKLKATELRIGNFIYHKGKPERVSSVDCVGETEIIHTEKRNWLEMSEVAPIPLTEQWLEMFGFKSSEEGYYDKELMQKRILAINPKNKEFTIGYGINWSYPFKIKYVHTLQNLYFALTGEELKISFKKFKKSDLFKL